MDTLAVDSKAPTSELVEGALRDMKDLVQVEIVLAKDELKREAREAKRSIIAFAASIVLLSTGLTLLILTLVIAFSMGPILTGAAGVLLLLGAGIAFQMGTKLFPTAILGETERRIESSIDLLKEHLS